MVELRVVPPQFLRRERLQLYAKLETLFILVCNGWNTINNMMKFSDIYKYEFK